MEYNYLLSRKKERTGRKREVCVSVSFLPCRKALYIVVWRRKKNNNSIKQVSETGAEIRDWRG